MPGLRGMPDVITTTSEFALSAKSLVPTPIDARGRAFDRARLVDVERDARRLGLGDVDDDDVGELLLRDRARHRGADIACAADHRHFSIHAVCLLPSFPAITRVASSAPTRRRGLGQIAVRLGNRSTLSVENPVENLV